MKKVFTILTLLALTIFANATPPFDQKKFDPEAFIKEQEAFITKEARLTQQEVNVFFPLFREMQQKQRALYRQQKQFAHTKPQDDKTAEKLISDMDNIDVQLKKIQIQYHSKFLKVLPATKVHQCIRAEERFKQKIMDRMALRRMENGKHNKK